MQSIVMIIGGKLYGPIVAIDGYGKKGLQEHNWMLNGVDLLNNWYKVAVWTSKNGQDDLMWPNNSRIRRKSNG